MATAPPNNPNVNFPKKLVGGKEFSIEFNDSVLDTHAWKNSRYEGKQLEGEEINVFVKGDKTFGKTPIIQHYTRNIYVGKKLIRDNTDRVYTGFKNTSQVVIDKSFTINSDDTITENIVTNPDKIFQSEGRIDGNKIGFERNFKDDFLPGSKAKIIIFDKGVENNLKPFYTVQFNDGLFAEILNCVTASVAETFQVVNEQFASISGFGSAILSMQMNFGRADQVFEAPNLTDLALRESQRGLILGGQQFDNTFPIQVRENQFTEFWTDASGSDDISDNFDFLFGNPDERFASSSIKTAFDLQQFMLGINHQIQTNKDRFFVEFYSTGSVAPSGSEKLDNRSAAQYNTAPGGIQKLNLAEIDSNITLDSSNPASTIVSVGLKNKYFFSNPNKEIFFEVLNTDFEKHFGLRQGNNFFRIYRLDQSNFSLLLDLDAEEDLPNGVGEEKFVVIPEDIHPDILENLGSNLKQLGFNIEANKNSEDSFRLKNRNNRFTKIFNNKEELVRNRMKGLFRG